MFIPFDKINPNARIWIYQSSRLLKEDEEIKIGQSGQQFIEQWTAHNQNLLGSFAILKHLFLIIAVDESLNGASGCSIDKSFSFIRQIEKKFTISLLDRKAIAYEASGEIKLTSLDSFEKLYKSTGVSDDTVIYNNLVTSKSELIENWRIPMNKSWLMQVM